MNNEFLRPRENSFKWFNNFGVKRKRQYIGKASKAKFLHKSNCVNRFIKQLNRFRHQNDKPGHKERLLRLMQVMRNVKLFELLWWRSESIQDYFESIQRESESLMIRLKNEWYDSNMNQFINIMNRFISSHRLKWDDSDKVETIHADKRHN